MLLSVNEVTVAITAEVMHMLRVSSPEYRTESEKNV